MRAAKAVVILAAAAAAGGCGNHGSATRTEVATAPQSATAGRPSSPEHLGPVGVSRAVHRSLPPLRPCRLLAEAANGGLLDAAVGGGATCSTARVVLLRVSHWKGRTCWSACPSDVRMARGFSCTTYKIGEADWSVNCWKRREVIHTSLAD
jgi:hypothetical protein